MRDDEEDSDLDLDIDLDLDDEDASVDDSAAGADAAPAGGAQPGRPAGGAPERPRATAPAAPAPPRRRLSLWRAFADWLRRHALLAPSRCVVLGPSASGKTALLMSLDQCEQEESHSFLQYRVFLRNVDDDFKAYRSRLSLFLRDGLNFSGTPLDDCVQPTFTLSLVQKTDEVPRGRQRGVRGMFAWLMRLGRRNVRKQFSTFDGAGGLLVPEGKSRKTEGEDGRFRKDKEGEERCRRMLGGALRSCDAVLICLPIDPAACGEYWEQEMTLKDIIHGFSDGHNVRNLVVCFTMYEKVGANLGRNAYRVLTSRTFAREAMRRALKKSKRILLALHEFRSSQPGRRVWCVPVSSFGFVPRNGGVNLDRSIRPDGSRADLLRTRYGESGHIDPDLLYSERQVRDDLWQPFATLDPFIFIANGFKDREGTLIHSYRELWRNH